MNAAIPDFTDESTLAVRSRSWSLHDPTKGLTNLRNIRTSLNPVDFSALLEVFDRALPGSADPDMALNQLERFLATPEGAARIASLLEAQARPLAALLGLFGSSHYFSELLIANSDDIVMLGVSLQRSPTREELRADLSSTVEAAFEDSAVLRAFRRYRQRHMLRIGANDLLRNRRLDEVTRDLSKVADEAVQVAYETAWRTITKRFGVPRVAGGAVARGVVMAFGKLGGRELNYSSDIDLMMIFDKEGDTDGRLAISNGEFFSRLTSEIVRLLSAHPQAYRVDLRLRPEGQRGPLARGLASALAYYDSLGRTWERQALIKVRPIAGDLPLGNQFLNAIEPFVYRKYLTFAEINEIKALKREIERKTSRAGGADVEVKTGTGGIRDIEFTIQYLQLLNGGELPGVRERNTLKAIDALEQAGCLTDQESGILHSGYAFLRAVEHRLQIMFDLQTHRLPEQPPELRKLAFRMWQWFHASVERRAAAAAGEIPVHSAEGALAWFVARFREKTELNRRILNHLLHETFAASAEGAEPESDLLLAPDPDPETIQRALGRYPFRDVRRAYHNLVQLAQESVPFLSTPRCRQFLASIAPRLLRAVAETPDPDMALNNLEKVTASLGAKGVLWELFSFNPPSLKLYVDLCAWSQFLSEILITNPGMIDELLDSLILNQPRAKVQLGRELSELCRGAADLEPILHSFQDKELLRIGVNDILGKEPLRVTLAALSDLAEVILEQIVYREYGRVVDRFGRPSLPNGGQTCRFAVLGLGKLGGREMSYSSDLDLILIYETDGTTVPPSAAETIPATSYFHFFSELARGVIKAASQIGPRGRLYEVDMRLRPTGKSGSLALPLPEFQRYHREGDAQLWERQAMTRARLVSGDPDFGGEVMTAAAEAVFDPPWQPSFAEEIRRMRQRLEASRSTRDFKRGFGGIVDIEFLVQALQLKFGRERPEIRQANIYDALEALGTAGILPMEDAAELLADYDFLRKVESRMRMVQNLTRDELPERPEELDQLARRLGFEAWLGHSAADLFLKEFETRTARTRNRFLRVLERETPRRSADSIPAGSPLQ